MARLMSKAKPLVAQVLAGEQPTKENGTKKRFALTIAERELLAKNRLMEEAVALFLDPEVDRTNRQIAEQLGMSLDKLKRMMQTEEFRDLYETQLVDIGHSPRLKQARATIDELLPLATRVVRNILTDPNTPPGVRLKAAEKILEYAPKDNGVGDQVKEFNLFLATFAAKSPVVAIPNEYADAMKKFADPNIVDGEVTELPTS